MQDRLRVALEVKGFSRVFQDSVVVGNLVQYRRGTRPSLRFLIDDVLPGSLVQHDEIPPAVSRHVPTVWAIDSNNQCWLNNGGNTLLQPVSFETLVEKVGAESIREDIRTNLGNSHAVEIKRVE